MEFISQIYMHLKSNSTLAIVIFIVLALFATWAATKMVEKGSHLFFILIFAVIGFFLYQSGILENILNFIN